MSKGLITVSTDWHVIREGDRAQNSTDPRLLREYLKWGYLDTDKVILGGDIFDLGKSTIDKIMYGDGAYVDLIKLIQNYMKYKKLEYIAGNHDWEMTKEWKLNDRLYIPEQKVMVMHGHQLDANPGFSGKCIERTLLKVLAFLERTVWEDIDQIPSFMEKNFHIDAESREKFFTNCQNYMNARGRTIPRKKHPVDTLFVGHIHGNPETRALEDGRKIVNCGCNVKVCLTNKKPEDEPGSYRSDYVVLDTRTGEITAKDMRDGF
jgi:predicted phosphodiesterase